MRFMLFVGSTLLVGFLGLLGVSGGEPLPLLTRMDPLGLVLALAVLFTVTGFFVGWWTGDYSWVDRLWSTLPVAFVWIFAAKSGWNARVVLVAILITFWGLRLTFNFARKGGYGQEEDYRWAHMRGVIRNPFLWQTFNLFFICIFQIGLFILFTLPVDRLARQGQLPLNLWDLLPAGLLLAFLALETVADQQQWNFHRRKKEDPNRDEETRQGFCSTGLFRLSRHPNFVGEMGVWWSVWLFAGIQLPWRESLLCLPGVLLLTALFQGSTRLTEQLTSAKYPGYAGYKKRTARLIPGLP